MEYQKIVNPKTGRYVSINGRLGKSILQNYVSFLTGGANLERTAQRQRLRQQTNHRRQMLEEKLIASQYELSCEEKLEAAIQENSELRAQINELHLRLGETSLGVSDVHSDCHGQINKDTGELEMVGDDCPDVSSLQEPESEPDSPSKPERKRKFGWDLLGLFGSEETSEGSEDLLENPDLGSPNSEETLKVPPVGRCDEDQPSDELRLSWGIDPDQAEYKKWMCECKGLMCDDDDEEDY